MTETTAGRRIPVVLWRDAVGQCIAQVLGDDEATSAAGTTERDVLQSLKAYLDWLAKDDGDVPGLDIDDPQHTTFRVPIRTEYRTNNRIYPSTESYRLRVDCIHGKHVSGAFVALLPWIGASFYYFEAKALADLVTRATQEHLKGATPADLAHALPPSKLELRQITVRAARGSRRETPQEPQLPQLRAIAEPLADRSVRRAWRAAWQRDDAIAKLVTTLRKPQGSVLLVGESGVGKTTVLAAAARQIVDRKLTAAEKASDVPQFPALRFWITSAGRIISGMKYLGQWEQRCEQLVQELDEIGGVLCLENLLELARIGGKEPTQSVANFLLPYIQRGELRMVAECTPTELDACRRELPGLVDAFQLQFLEEFDRPQAVAVLQQQATQLEHEQSMKVAAGVPDLIERLIRRHWRHQAFPGPAVQFLASIAHDLRRQSRVTRGQPPLEITTETVIRQFVKRSGLPELFLRDDWLLNANDVAQFFAERVIGQPRACQTATNAVLTFKASLNDPQRPLGVYLFAGPTGVGKTELAKAITEYFFGHGEGQPSERLVRVDCSEFSGFNAAHRLLQQPDGEPSRLIQAVRRQPLCVVLLDEIEKAADDVFDILLTLLDEGRLTDRFGRVTDFRNAFLILTSNLGGDQQQAVGFSDAPANRFDQAVRSFFRPEFFNRLDEVVTFQPLTLSDIRRIAARELGLLGRREAFRQRSLDLRWTDAVVAAVIAAGYDPRYGVRPLQRALQRLLVGPLAEWLNAHPDVRSTTVNVDWIDEVPRFS